MSPKILRLGFLVILPFAGSCHTSGRQYEVAGMVTYGGEALAAGQIFFAPDYAAGNDGPAGMAIIKGGKFDTRDQGRGVIGGPYTIRIDGFDGRTGAELPMGKQLFATYEEKRVLPSHHSTQNFNVPR